MIRECEDDGYYRGDECPECGERGKFIMSDEEIKNLGKTTAGILRHFPDKYGLDMDERGWVDLEHYIKALRNRQKRFHWLRRYHMDALVATDPKGRYQVEEGYIRATYAHSVDVELDHPTENIPEKLYFPTTEKEAELLLEGGIKASDRTYVHLSETYESAVGAGVVRTEKPVILCIDTQKAIEEGETIMEAGDGVYITKKVEPEYISIHEEQPSEEEIATYTEEKKKREERESR
ncbi:MAG: RNA 2'-phosphotransferase [Thermoplasmata archaeon]